MILLYPLQIMFYIYTILLKTTIGYRQGNIEKKKKEEEEEEEEEEEGIFLTRDIINKQTNKQTKRRIIIYL